MHGVSGVPNAKRGEKIRIGCLTPTFSGTHKWVELLRHPCVLGGPQQRGQNQSGCIGGKDKTLDVQPKRISHQFRKNGVPASKNTLKKPPRTILKNRGVFPTTPPPRAIRFLRNPTTTLLWLLLFTVSLLWALSTGAPFAYHRLGRGIGLWVSLCTTPHRRGSGQWVSYTTLHCREQWAVGLLQYTAALQRVVGSGYPSVHCRTARGSGQCTSFGTLCASFKAWGGGGCRGWTPTTPAPSNCWPQAPWGGLGAGKGVVGEAMGEGGPGGSVEAGV